MTEIERLDAFIGEWSLEAVFPDGVARLYEMSFSDGTWKLWRDKADFSPLDFSQRFEASLSDDGRTIAGGWEISKDGSSWEHDFDLTYTKVE